MPFAELHYPSPKRKRDHAPPVPLLNTTLRRASTPPQASPAPSSGASSPRNAVAAQLQSMSLAPDATIPMSPLSPTDHVVHKRPKLDDTSLDRGTPTAEGSAIKETDLDDNDQPLKAAIPASSSTSAKATQEVPDATQPRILLDTTPFTRPTTFNPSPTITVLPYRAPQATKSRSQNWSTPLPRARNRSPSPPPSALTWKDSEITGHLTGPANDPDDDGTGLNGIGFKPTPATAYARSQRRRQQVNEWKARETREARAKRSERRRRGVGGLASREVTLEKDAPLKNVVATKRTVKFAV